MVEINPQAVQVINRCLEILLNPNETERLQQIQAVLHSSLLFTNPDGTTVLSRNVKEFSYQKAVQNVAAYHYPAEITSVRQGNEITLGIGPTAESGRTDSYFIAKRAGVAGIPAPIVVFFPDNKSEPKITNLGSL